MRRGRKAGQSAASIEAAVNGNNDVVDAAGKQCPTHGTKVNAFGFCRDCIADERRARDKAVSPGETPTGRRCSVHGTLLDSVGFCYDCQAGRPAGYLTENRHPCIEVVIQDPPAKPTSDAAGDVELAAISACLQALAPLRPDAIRRVLAYLGARGGQA